MGFLMGVTVGALVEILGTVGSEITVDAGIGILRMVMVGELVGNPVGDNVGFEVITVVGSTLLSNPITLKIRIAMAIRVIATTTYTAYATHRLRSDELTESSSSITMADIDSGYIHRSLPDLPLRPLELD